VAAEDAVSADRMEVVMERHAELLEHLARIHEALEQLPSSVILGGVRWRLEQVELFAGLIVRDVLRES
jgi:hypothetical protein